MKEATEATPTLASCLAAMILIGVLVHDQMWASADREQRPTLRMGAESTETKPAAPESRSTQPEIENAPESEPQGEREPPKNRVRARFTMPA